MYIITLDDEDPVEDHKDAREQYERVKIPIHITYYLVSFVPRGVSFVC